MNSVLVPLITVALCQSPFADAFNETIHRGLAKRDLTDSMSLVAYLELGAKPVAKAEAIKELMAKGSAKIFLSEIAKLRKQMRKEDFSSLTLAGAFLDMETETPGDWKTAEHPQGTRLLSVLIRRPSEKDTSRPRTERDARGVQCFAHDRPKSAQAKGPITAHCSFVFLAHSDAKVALRTLSFDLYLEKLAPHEGTILTYPWRVENVQYK